MTLMSQFIYSESKTYSAASVVHLRILKHLVDKKKKHIVMGQIHCQNNVAVVFSSWFCVSCVGVYKECFENELLETLNTK